MQTKKVHRHLLGKSYQEIIYALNIVEDNGDCCGWTQCKDQDSLTNLPLKDKDRAILVDCILISYPEEHSSREVLNFIFSLDGDDGLLLGYDLSAGSGSGWHYGASVSLRYKDELLAKASW
jgi:hypothetical protein